MRKHASPIVGTPRVSGIRLSPANLWQTMAECGRRLYGTDLAKLTLVTAYLRAPVMGDDEDHCGADERGTARVNRKSNTRLNL